LRAHDYEGIVREPYVDPNLANLKSFSKKFMTPEP